MFQLALKEYVSQIHLKEIYTPSVYFFGYKEQIVDELLNTLLNENDVLKNNEIPKDYEGKRKLLKSLFNVREPKPLDSDSLRRVDTLLQTELRENDIVEVEKLSNVANFIPNNSFHHSDKFILWQGDITHLKADAIVNAANKYMLGCFQPLHPCIDNAIHSSAGPLLRNDCEKIMKIQSELEETGGAKITRGYNLPARFVLHTVGPIVPKESELTDKQREELASCYISCLELAKEVAEIKTVAFCAISTGVFGFPKQEAANIAIKTVNEWLNSNPNHFEKIIFNVFGDEDYREYLKVFQS